MNILEKLIRQRKQITSESPKSEEDSSGEFALEIDGSLRRLVEDELIPICSQFSETLTSITIHVVRKNRVEIQIQWTNDYFLSFEWGMINRFVPQLNTTSEKPTYSKVVKFAVGLTQSAIYRKDNGYQLEDCPLWFSENFERLYFCGHPLLSWVPSG